LQATDEAAAEPETEQEIKEWQKVEEIVKTDDSTPPETVQDAADVLHIVGDIIRVRRYLIICVCR